MADEPTFRVVDVNGTQIFPNDFYRRENAQQEADLLNAEGLQEFAPYRVEAVA